MKKNLLYTALGLIGLMGTLAIGVVNAEDGMNGVTKTPGNITYTDTNGKIFTDIGTITLTDGDKSITMLDRNLGATSTDITGTDSYGYHFQWGNNYGFTRVDNESDEFAGDEALVDGDSEGYADTSSNVWNNPYVSGAFIMDSDRSDGGWDSPNNHDLRGGANDYSNGWGDSSADYKRQGPCPAGYHVPSQKELDDLLVMYHTLNTSGTLGGSDYGHYVSNSTFSTNFREAFNMPFAGYRHLEDGKVYGMGDYLYFWSSSAFDASYPTSRYLYAYASNVHANDDRDRGRAQSVRCFLDSPLDDSGAQPLILEYETNGGSAIQSQTIPAGEKGYLPGYTTSKSGANFLGWFNEDGTEPYDLEMGVPTNNFTMSADIADENGIVKVYAKWGYNVTFVNRNGDEIAVVPVEHGGSAIAPEDPEREGYIFSGWDTDFSNVIEDITVTAQYKQAFTITWKDGDGNALATGSVAEGDMPVYEGATPTKTATSDYKYTFNQTWLPEIVAASADAEYVAQFDETAIEKKSGGSSGGGGRSSQTLSDSENKNDTGEKIPPVSPLTEVGLEQPEGQNDASLIKGGADPEVTNGEAEGFTLEFQEAYEFAKEKGITTMPTIQQANMNGKLTRIAMAKMLSYYAINVLGQKPDETRINKFNDITEKLDAQYDSGVTLAYQLGIMGINMPNNNFRPNDEVTRAEFATALSRMLYSTPDGKPYYTTHLAKLKAEKILTNDDYKMKELRGYVMIMLMRSAK